MAVVISKFEFRRLDDKSADALDKPAPVGRAAELAVVDDLQPDVFLHRDSLADAIVEDFIERFVIDLLGGVIAERLPQRGWAQQAADVIGAKRRLAGPLYRMQMSSLLAEGPHAIVKVKPIKSGFAGTKPGVFSRVVWTDQPAGAAP